MDVLSDVLRVVRLAGVVFFTAKVSSPWAVKFPPPDTLARLLPPARCVTLFHILVEGECRLSLPGHAAFPLRAGEIAVFPHGDAHVMSSSAGLAPVPLSSMGRETRLVCGYLHCDQRSNPLMGALPPLLLVRQSGATVHVESPTDAPAHAGPPLRSAEASWLGSTLRLTVEEAHQNRPGSAAMLARLTEILFVEVLRAHMEQMPAGHTGWLAGVRDAEVGRALGLLHAGPERKWTVEHLAREVGRSRSALAQRFAGYVGMPPMRYLAQWRMQLATHLLRQPGLTVAEVAVRVGYDAEAAFSRAFKRHAGEPPASWRAHRL